MSLKKFKQKIRGMSDRDLHRLERSLDKRIEVAGAGLIGSGTSAVLTIPLLGIPGVAILGGIGIPSAIAFSRFSSRLDVINKELDKRHKERRSKRQRLLREVKLHGKARLRKMM